MIVVWRVTERCNLSCPFCAYDRRVERSRREADPAAILRFARVLAEHATRTGTRVLVSWLGGEPLLWPPLTGIAAELRALGLELGVTTNGTTLGSPGVQEHLLACYAELTVSVDGPPEVHDALRGWPRGHAALARSLRELAARKRAAGRGPLLRANVVLMRATIAGFGALCEELAAFGVEQITFNQLGGFDRPEFWPAHRLLPDQVEEFARGLDDLRARLARLGVALLGSPGYLERMRRSAQDRTLPIEDCGPGRAFLFVDERGRIAPCSFTVDTCGVDLATIVDHAALLALPARFAALRAERRPGPCLDCHSTQVAGKFAHDG